MDGSEWAADRFGAASEELAKAVVEAVRQAHGDAAAAQASSNTSKRDPYGHTLKNRQHECLVEHAKGVDGVQVHRPPGTSFELVRIVATRTVLFPWRYATDSAKSRVKARMRTSGFRRGLLAGPTAEAAGQTTIEQADWTEDEIETQFAEDKAVWDQLRNLARVVTVGYASNPKAIIHLGWGDAELVDDVGTVAWQHWEPLSLTVASSKSGGADATDARHLKVIDSQAARPHLSRPRFDGAGLDEDIVLSPRHPLAGEPQQEPEPTILDTGTEDEQR